jgi:hypothetical protein
MPRFFKWYISFSFPPPKLCMHYSFPPIHATCRTHLTQLDVIALAIFGEQLIARSYSHVVFSSHFLLLSPRYIPQHPILSRTPSASVLPLMPETRFRTRTKSCEVPLLVLLFINHEAQRHRRRQWIHSLSGAIKSKPFRILAYFLQEQQRCGPNRPAVHSTSCCWCVCLSVRPPVRP